MKNVIFYIAFGLFSQISKAKGQFNMHVFFHYGFKEHHSSFEQALSLDIYVHFKILLQQPPTI